MNVTKHELSAHLSRAENYRAWADTQPSVHDITDINAAIESWEQKVNVLDVIDELHDALDVLQAAIDSKDPSMVGKIVLAVAKGYAKRLAIAEVYGDAEGEPGALECAAGAMVSSLSNGA